jgi:hypothetical protein
MTSRSLLADPTSSASWSGAGSTTVVWWAIEANDHQKGRPKLNRAIMAASTALCIVVALPTFARGVTCQSQAALDALAAEITKKANEHPECFTGTCYPITLRPGDLTPISGGSLRDKNGNVWTLVPKPGELWYGGVAKNGALLWPGYDSALRSINGVIYEQEAKFGGWRVQPSKPWLENDGKNWQFVGPDPGSGDLCRRGRQSRF